MDENPPTVAPAVRTWCYILGALFGLGLTPPLVLLATQSGDLWAGVAAALAGGLSGAFNALAFGYRPTR
jgi:hypothetical protein